MTPEQPDDRRQLSPTELWVLRIVLGSVAIRCFVLDPPTPEDINHATFVFFG